MRKAKSKLQNMINGTDQEKTSYSGMGAAKKVSSAVWNTILTRLSSRYKGKRHWKSPGQCQFSRLWAVSLKKTTRTRPQMANQTFLSALHADIMFSRWTVVYLVLPMTQVTKTTSLLIFKSKTTLVVTRNLPVLHRHQYEPHRSKMVTSLFAKLT